MSFSKFNEFIPKSYFCFARGYNFSIFKKDLLAGVTVGIIALPLAMAFAIASGVPPERGLYTAIIAGFLISALGGSRVQIGGPTGAFVVIAYGIVQRTGYEGLCLSTILAACILVLLGIFRIGSWIKYVPHPLITGFTTGIAVVIFSTQMKDFFGLQMGTPPADFIEKWQSYFTAFPTFNFLALFLATATLGFILCVRRFLSWLPWGISAIVLATWICWVFDLPLETIQSRFGEIPRNLPTPSFPNFFILEGKFKEIFADGVTIAFLGSIESLLSAVIADGMIGARHRSNCELVAQGIANLGSVVFGGIPATGAIARTVANIKTGAQTPMAGMIHAVVLFLIMYFLAPIVSQIPLAALSAVLVMVAWNMSEIHHFIRLLKAPYEDRVVLLITFFLTVLVDLTIAISVGMVLASLFFMKQMSQISKVVPLSRMFQETQRDLDVIPEKNISPGIEIYEIQGPLFFGAANIFRDFLSDLMMLPKVFILRMNSVPIIDASGMRGLEEFYDQCKKNNVLLLLSGVHEQTRCDLRKLGLIDRIGEEQIFSDIRTALVRAEKVVSLEDSRLN